MPLRSKGRKQSIIQPKANARQPKVKASSQNNNLPVEQREEKVTGQQQPYSAQRTSITSKKPNFTPPLTRRRQETTKTSLLSGLESDRAIRKKVRQPREDIVPTVEGTESSPIPERTPSRSESESIPQGRIDQSIDSATCLLQAIQYTRNAGDVRSSAQKAESLVDELKAILDSYQEDLTSMTDSVKSAGNKLSDSEKEKILDNSRVQRRVTEGYTDNKKDRDIIEKIRKASDSPRTITNKEEEFWKSDLTKCRNSHEAVYQRTVLTQTIDRHYYADLGTKLDYTVELPWKNASPPIKEHGQRYLWSPVPDLAVGFRQRLFFEDQGYSDDDLPEILKRRMLPEDAKTPDPGRAFPFLMFEAKGAASALGGKASTYQSLNYGCQALYNIWKFIQGDEERMKGFFDKVRVFTAGGHGHGFWIRIHRAASKGDMLKFQYHDIEELAGDGYTQARVQTLLRNVMSWALDELLPYLQKAVEYACKNEHTKNKLPPETLQGGKPRNRKPRATSTSKSATPADEMLQALDSESRRNSKRPSQAIENVRRSKRSKDQEALPTNANVSFQSSIGASQLNAVDLNNN